MSKKILVCIVAIVAMLSLSACSNNSNEVQEIPSYSLINEMAASDIKKVVNQFIIDVYSPNNQEQIDKALVDFCKIATEQEINTLTEEIGVYDEAKKASLKNVVISIATPKNTENNKMKILATFDVSINDINQSVMIEFRCNNDNMIESHSIWVNNG